MTHEITVCMHNPQRHILMEISDKAFNRKSVASTYAWCMRQRGECDFKIINRAILGRWSPSGLEYIKKLAWGRFGGRA